LEPGGRWAGILQASLRAGVPCVVEVTGADDGVVVADAVRLVQLR
jgi:UDP:flavonoid glycosyltransferase YjiC (YdhE family)